MKKTTPTSFASADQYQVGTRIQSDFTRRVGTVAEWPGHDLPIVGAVWVEWDDGKRSHAWRHQVHRY